MLWKNLKVLRLALSRLPVVSANGQHKIRHGPLHGLLLAQVLRNKNKLCFEIKTKTKTVANTMYHRCSSFKFPDHHLTFLQVPADKNLYISRLRTMSAVSVRDQKDSQNGYGTIVSHRMVPYDG